MGPHDAKEPFEAGTGRAVVSPAASTLRDEMAVSGQSLPATSGQSSDGRFLGPAGHGGIVRACPPDQGKRFAGFNADSTGPRR
jgi:hypothetical protein